MTIKKRKEMTENAIESMKLKWKEYDNRREIERINHE